MNFSYSDEQRMLQESVQRFIQKNYDFDTRTAIVKSEQGYSEEYWKVFAELGWLTIPFKEADGGFGGSAVDLMVIMEEFGAGMVVDPFLATAVIAGGLIAELGSEAQKEELLGKIMQGELQLACAFSEVNSRFNLAYVSVEAKKKGGNYVLNGEKIAVLNGSNANKILVVARTSGSMLDSDGISIFLVESGSDGLKKNVYTNVDGQKASNIKFESVTVSADQLLGEEGAALVALKRVIDTATVAICAEAVGVMNLLLNKTVEYTKIRKQFGTTISTFQALQHRMADMFIECQLAKSIVTMAALALDGDGSDEEKAKAVSAAKSRVGKAIRLVGQESIQIHGGIAMTDELDVGHLFKRITVVESSFGNSDFHTMRFANS